MKTKAELTQEVNRLIEKNNDAYLGYQNAAQNVSNTHLKSFLEQQADRRNRYAMELKSEVRSYEPSADMNNSGSLKGDLHRGWMDIKAALSNDSEEQVLEECIRGEQASMAEYHEVLQKVEELPQSICNAIQKQHAEIHETISKVKSLEDLH